jgi:heavy metal sensor kinase
MKPLKLRTKLTLFYAIVFTLLLAAVSMLFYQLFKFQLDRALAEELNDRSAGLRGYLRFENGQPRLVYDASDPEQASFIATTTRYFQIYDGTSCAMITRSPDMEALGFRYAPEEVKGVIEELVGGFDLSLIQTDQVSLLVHNDLVRGPNKRSYLIQIGVSLHSRDLALTQLLKISLWLVPSGILVAILLGWWMVRFVLRPVKDLGAVAREISISRLDKRLPVHGAGDEMDQLANIFNNVLERLEKTVGQMRDFTANISHELRTPLTALRGEAAVALAKGGTESDYRRVLESQLEELEKLSRMINQMLILARAEAGQIPLAHETVNLGALARSIVEQMEAVAWSKEIALATECGGDVVVTGDSGWLERAILNLLDNAIKFTEEGGRIKVSVYSREGQAVLEVSDSGIGIATDVLPRIFERFYRGDPSRSQELEGAGLGLSLVDWIVREHDGRVTVESHSEQGSVFRILLPCLLAAPSQGNNLPARESADSQIK